jgi:hypothetical protein
MNGLITALFVISGPDAGQALGFGASDCTQILVLHRLVLFDHALVPEGKHAFLCFEPLLELVEGFLEVELLHNLMLPVFTSDQITDAFSTRWGTGFPTVSLQVAQSFAQQKSWPKRLFSPLQASYSLTTCKNPT